MDNPGKALAALRRQERKLCLACGEAMVGLHAKMYCSPKCKWRVWWLKNRESFNEGRRKGNGA